MPAFVLLTRLSPETLHQPRSLRTLERHVAEQVAEHCPDVTWLSSWALTGPWDYLDIFEAPDMETATRVSILVRSYGRAHSELWPAMPWAAFKALLQTLPADHPAR